MEEHNKTLEAVQQRAVDFGVMFNPHKCQFGVKEIEFYGHKFTKDGLKPDPGKIRAVKESSPPESKEVVRSFFLKKETVSKQREKYDIQCNIRFHMRISILAVPHVLQM